MKPIGFKVSLSSPCVFLHEERMLRAVVHGDDFTNLGQEKHLMWLRQQIKKMLEVKFRGLLGPEDRDAKK